MLPASYRQVPRILVSRFFPEHAHVFLAVAQLSQSVSLIYSVKFQIPYRKLIARRTHAYQRVLRPVTVKLASLVAFIGIVYLPVSLYVPLDYLGQGGTAVALVPLLAADALAFGLFSSHLGLLPWFTRKVDAVVSYLLCLVAAALIVVGLIGLGLTTWLSIFTIPTVTIGLGMVWLAIIMKRHFDRVSG